MNEPYRWLYTFGESEVWLSAETFSTRQEAIHKGMNHPDYEDFKLYGSNLYIGQLDEFPLPELMFNVDHIIEGIQENMYDEIGEVSEGYLNDIKPDVYNDLENRLQYVVAEWLDEHKLRPTFSSIINVEQITNFKSSDGDV